MGYDIWVADDPELEREDLCSLPWAYPYFSITIRGLRDIREEMSAQGMTTDSDLPYTEEQIAHALAMASPQPSR